MANLKGSNWDRQIRDANFRLAAFGEKRKGTNSHRTHSNALRVKRDGYLSDFREFTEEKGLEGKLNELMNEANLTEMFEERLRGLDFSTQEDYFRGWSGMIQGLQQVNVSVNIDVSFFNEIVGDYREDALSRGESIGEPKLVTTPYHPTEVIDSLKTPLSVIAQLQYETGLRVSEAYAVINDLERHLNDLRLHSVQGKGGQIYRDKIISLELRLALLKVQAEQLKIPHQSTYYRHLQRYDMCSHDIRAFYAKELYEQKIDEGCTHVKACAFVSKEINHHRIEITEYYLAKFA